VRVAAAIPLAVGAILAILFIGLLLVLLASGSVGSSGWSVADSPYVLVVTFFLLEGIAGATGIAAVLAARDGGSRSTWMVLGVVGGALAVVPLVWFADIARALVLAAPCAYLAVYAGVRVWRAAGARHAERVHSPGSWPISAGHRSSHDPSPSSCARARVLVS
jgi:hypothetical protein